MYIYIYICKSIYIYILDSIYDIICVCVYMICIYIHYVRLPHDMT
jgi:hypothetical protein